MIHLRIVAPEDVAHQALELLCTAPSVINVVHLRGASKKPQGDVILCDITREDASVMWRAARWRRWQSASRRG